LEFTYINNVKIAYKLLGSGKNTIVIDAAIGTCNAEWWHIAEKMSINCKVITYDRAGYGESQNSKNTRSPKNIAIELNNLLVSLNINDNIILLGHSQGGLYLIQYALMFPSKVIGMVLLDPATPYDYEFKEGLTENEYKKSGVDKTLGLKIGLWLTSFGIGFLFKRVLRKMPPFYYFKFSKQAEEYLLNSLCKKSTYKTALEEYKNSHIENNISDIKWAIDNKTLNSLPIILILHSSKVYQKELQEYGNTDLNITNRIENIWQNIMTKVLGLSVNSKKIIAENSGHYIHLTDLDIVLQSIKKIMQK
jgi:pimeloyl-ACP methyl ester carboxylesterase